MSGVGPHGGLHQTKPGNYRIYGRCRWARTRLARGSVQVENADGTFLFSSQSEVRGGVAAAFADDIVPTSAADDFSGVSVIAQPGANTWPLASVTYIYVRQDLSFIPATQEQALLKVFLQSLYEDSHGAYCHFRYGMNRVDGAARQLALDAIDSLILDPAAIPFQIETDTMLIEGAGANIISTKRGSAMAYRIAELTTANEKLNSKVSDLEKRIVGLERLLLQSVADTSSNEIPAAEAIATTKEAFP